MFLPKTIKNMMFSLDPTYVKGKAALVFLPTLLGCLGSSPLISDEQVVTLEVSLQDPVIDTLKKDSVSSGL